MFRSNRSANEAISRHVRLEKYRLLSAFLRVFLPGDLNRKPSCGQTYFYGMFEKRVRLPRSFICKTKIARCKAKESFERCLKKRNLVLELRYLMYKENSRTYARRTKRSSKKTVIFPLSKKVTLKRDIVT